MRSPRVCILLMAGVCSLAAQSKRPEDLALGKILVTPRNAPDSAFAESVILLVRYNDDEAVGLMVNRRSKVPVSQALQELKTAAGHSEPVFIGGPVELNTVMALARASKEPEGGTAVLGNIYVIGSKTGLEKALGGPDPKAVRTYLGYVGWGPHQLENEVRLGAWYIFGRGQDMAFDAEPDTLWTRMVARTEQQLVFAPLGPAARSSR